MQIVQKYFPALTPQQVEQYSQLQSLYTYWNERINVISRKDIENLYLHHVLHSMAISRIISFRTGTVVMDAGTGGGFPGIPLAILFPDVHFILVDSIAKKVRVVESIIREIRIGNAEVRNIRLEGLHENSDFVVCRAVADIPVLYGWIKTNIVPGGFNDLPNGLLALKGGELDKELRVMKQEVKVYPLNEYFSETYFETKKLVYVKG
jgi:16S rRNA (guanine527-N7)-methyltransferase